MGKLIYYHDSGYLAWFVVLPSIPKSTFMMATMLVGVAVLPLALYPRMAAQPSTIIGTSMPVHRTFWLTGSASLNWNRTNPNPGPFMSVVDGDLVTILLISDDGFTHSWLLDINNNNAVDPNEPFSGLFSSTTTFSNFTFTPTIGGNIPAPGNFTYKCSVHPFTMFGTFRVMPSQVSISQSFTATLDGSRVTTNGSLIIDTRTLTLSGAITTDLVNSTTGVTLFTKTYLIPNIQLRPMQNSPTQITRFLMNAGGALAHSVEMSVQLSGLTMSSTSLLTRQLDINANGVVDLGDVSVAALAFGSIIGTMKYKSSADFNADGVINLADISVIALYFARIDLR